jgi:Flp pilus assembly pilin Flp
MRHLRAWRACLRSATSERGQALVEYALVLALVSVVATAALAAVGSTVQSTYDHMNDVLEQVLGRHGHCGHKDCKP